MASVVVPGRAGSQNVRKGAPLLLLIGALLIALIVLPSALNLPQTNFAMEAKLVQNEPARLAKWQSMELYKMLMRQRAGGPQWILHDGPPFANGDIHIGHLINKTLKDVFQTATYPTATFVSTQIAKAGANTGTVTGNLTLAGVTKPVTLNVTFNGGRNIPIPFQRYRIGFDATGTIKRSDFGLTGMIWSGFVSDEVTLTIDCEMEKK